MKRYSKDVIAEAVKKVQEGRTKDAVGKEMGITASSIGRWVA